MGSKNVETARAAYQAFNSRDFDAILRMVSDRVIYEDRARGETFKGRDGYLGFLQGWVASFSNAECAQLKLVDGGDTVVAEFIGRGTNDGPLGPLPKSGKQLNLPFCEIIRFNEQGEIISAAIYYDQLSMMAQLGHAQPVEAAAS